MGSKQKREERHVLKSCSKVHMCRGISVWKLCCKYECIKLQAKEKPQWTKWNFPLEAPMILRVQEATASSGDMILQHSRKAESDTALCGHSWARELSKGIPKVTSTESCYTRWEQTVSKSDLLWRWAGLRNHRQYITWEHYMEAVGYKLGFPSQWPAPVLEQSLRMYPESSAMY